MSPVISECGYRKRISRDRVACNRTLRVTVSAPDHKPQTVRVLYDREEAEKLSAERRPSKLVR